MESDDYLLSQYWITVGQRIGKKSDLPWTVIDIYKGNHYKRLKEFRRREKDISLWSQFHNTKNEAGNCKDDDKPKPPTILTLSAVANAFNVMRRYVIKILWLEMIISVVNGFFNARYITTMF